MKANKASGNGHTEFWKLLAKTIIQYPHKVQRLLHQHGILVPAKNDALVDGTLQAMQHKGAAFHRDLAALLAINTEDNFVGAVASAVGSVANAISGGQQNKALKEQARANTLSSILDFKAQQERNRMEQLKLAAAQRQAKVQDKPGKLSTQTLVIIAGVVVALLIIGLALYSKSNRHPVMPHTTGSKQVK